MKWSGALQAFKEEEEEEEEEEDVELEG